MTNPTSSYVCKVNVPFYIGSRIRNTKNGSFIQTISNLTVFTVSAGLAILIITYVILGGFKKTIRNKLVSFDSHIQLKKYELTDAYITSPLKFDSTLYNELKSNPEIVSVNTYGLSAGILQEKNEVVGVVFKGVNEDFNQDIFGQNIIEGRLPSFQDKNEVVLSKKLSQKFQLKVGDKFSVYFFHGSRPKPRRFRLVGIYQTGLEEIDEHFMLGDIQMLRGVANWADFEIGGYELFIKNPEMADVVVEDVEFSESAFFDTEAVLITEKYQYLFQWLTMVDQNAVILVIIIFVIVFFNLLSTMYLLVVERRSTIGLLKSLGGGNGMLVKIFWYSSIKLVLKGVFIGNAVAISFCLIQFYTKIIPLDAENYYMESVPILWDWTIWGIINIGTLLVVGLVALIPILSSVKMSPVKAIKFN